MSRISKERADAIASSIDRLLRAHPGENERYSPFMTQASGRLGETVKLLDVRPKTTVEELTQYLDILSATLPPVGDM